MFYSHTNSLVVQLWVTGNWHWYLKLEIAPSNSKRFTTVQWHPEQGRTLYLASEGKRCQNLVKISDRVLGSLIEYQLEYETCASLCGPPTDLGMVAVVDRGNAFSLWLCQS